MSTTYVTLTDLPLRLQKQIPYSIRTYKNVYTLDELPYDIRELIEEYLITEKDVQYTRVLDCVPEISQYGDLSVVDSVYSMVVEYFKNYLLLLQGDYPFDPSFYCRLRLYLQNRDTDAKKKLISAEIHNIAENLSADLDNINIVVTSIDISSTSKSNCSVEYNCYIKLKINNKEISVNMSLPVNTLS